LCYEVTMNLAYRWFCKLKITDKVPDHSTFSKNRHGRFRDSEVFRFVFEEVLKRCMEEGLIGGEGFAVDASVVKADASKQKHHEDDDDDWGGGSRAINEYLDAIDADGSSTPSARKVSQTDPMSRWTAVLGGPAYYAYSTNYLVDTEAGIEPHVPVWDRGEGKDGRFGPAPTSSTMSRQTSIPVPTARS
jgi:hypothetical protein